jgi:hypothetical protein
MLVKNWIASKHATLELEIKQLNASQDPNPVIRIEGGLPDLLGTNIIMPELPTDPEVIEAEPSAQTESIVEPAE